ncbi:MAG: putative metallopeptidase [Candidatus Pacearchaeota archaeon]|jgi:predicted metallopeptidase
MGIKYEKASDIQDRIIELSNMLFPHVKLDSVVCLRSHGSGSRGTIARCHALGKAMQIALDRKGFYLIEVISERFDRMSEIDQTKTLIHELMHIPKSFGGGFIHHNIVHARNVERVYEHYINLKRKDDNINIISEDKSVYIEPKVRRGFEIEEPKTKRRYWFS